MPPHARDFEYGEIIGRYTGEKLGPPGGAEERKRLEAGVDMLLTLETGPKGADEVVDGSSAGAPYLQVQRANDAHGLTDEKLKGSRGRTVRGLSGPAERGDEINAQRGGEEGDETGGEMAEGRRTRGVAWLQSTKTVKIN